MSAAATARRDRGTVDLEASRDLPNSVSAPRQAREFSRDVLRSWGLDGLTDVVALLVSELVTNSVRYTDGDIGLRLVRRTDSILLEVVDDETRVPTVRHPSIDEERGRGLLLVSELTADWGTEVREGGKAVWFRLPLAPPNRDGASVPHA